MLTDEELTTELRAAFRGATDDLTYQAAPSRRRVPRSILVGLPAAAAVAAFVIVPATLGDGGTPAPSHELTAPVTTLTPKAGKVVKAHLSLAGYTFTYERASGEPAPLFAVLGLAGVPDDATSIKDFAGNGRAWVGTDPDRGYNAVFVEVTTRNGGSLFALESPTYTQDELVNVLETGTPQVVPAVGATDSP